MCLLDGEYSLRVDELKSQKCRESRPLTWFFEGAIRKYLRPGTDSHFEISDLKACVILRRINRLLLSISEPTSK